ncbi:hypothetical protein EJB05_09388, partial [Eragrostis curvula]
MKTYSVLGLRWRRGRAEWCRQGGGVVTSSTGERRQRTGGGGEGGGEERACGGGAPAVAARAEVRRWHGDGLLGGAEAARPVVAAGWRRRLRSDAFDGATLTSTAFLSIFAFRYVSYIAPLVGQLEDLHGLMRLLLLGQLTKTLHVLQDEATWDSQLRHLAEAHGGARRRSACVAAAARRERAEAERLGGAAAARRGRAEAERRAARRWLAEEALRRSPVVEVERGTAEARRFKFASCEDNCFIKYFLSMGPKNLIVPSFSEDA